MSDIATFSPRRFAAVLVNSERFKSGGDLLLALGCDFTSVGAIDVPSRDWSFDAGTISGPKKYSVAARNTLDSEGDYSHRMYVAVARHGQRNYALIVSPYVNLLRDSLRKLAPPQDASVEFIKPSMDDLFAYFETARPTELTATRISVLMIGDIGLELVSLAGRNPLRSELRRALGNIASPYAIRVKGTFLDRRGTNIHADRHGNIWFYLGSEASLVNLAALLSVLIYHGGPLLTTNSPLDRISEEASEE